MAGSAFRCFWVCCFCFGPAIRHFGGSNGSKSKGEGIGRLFEAFAHFFLSLTRRLIGFPFQEDYEWGIRKVATTDSSTPQTPRRRRPMEAAANGFHAARERYRKRRASRASTTSADGVRQWRIVSRISARELTLTDEQCEQLAESFAAIPDKYYAFEQMFLQLFRDDPQMTQVFGFEGIEDKELRRMSPFRTHVCKFQRFLTTVLDMLPKRNREEELIQILRMVGRQHCDKQLSFTASKWLSFKSAMLATLSKGETDKYYSAWNILISFMIYELKDAYLAHIRQLRSNSLPHVLESYRLEFRKAAESSTDVDETSSLSQSVQEVNIG